MTSENRPTMPAGYSLMTAAINGVEKHGMWFVFKNKGGADFAFAQFLDVLHMILNNIGNTNNGVFEWADLVDGKIDIAYAYCTPVKTSEIPDEGMTRWHTYLNTTTGKYELPVINSQVHTHHEREHDSDVISAEAEICGVEIDLMHRKAVLRNLNPDQSAHVNTVYADLDDCIDTIVDANAEPAIERAWLKSLGDIKHTGERNPEAHYVERANDFADAYLAHIASKTTGQLTAHRYEYHLCLINELKADKDRTGSSRFLPKGVKIVKTLSNPKVKEEVTAAQVFTKLRALIVPVDGAPKQPV